MPARCQVQMCAASCAHLNHPIQSPPVLRQGPCNRVKLLQDPRWQQVQGAMQSPSNGMYCSPEEGLHARRQLPAEEARPQEHSH
jgi:hypothetical protein